MDLSAVPIGRNPPVDVNVVIEVPIGGEPIKYEMHKPSGALMVDRFLYTSMRYPGNYGFIPNTLSGDGDPCDVIVANTRALVPGAIISCRIVGVLLMEDEAGMDEKLIAVPSTWLTKRYDSVAELQRPAEDHPRPDRALLHPLQGPGTRQVGQAGRLARCGGGAGAGDGGGGAGESRRLKPGLSPQAGVATADIATAPSQRIASRAPSTDAVRRIA